MQQDFAPAHSAKTPTNWFADHDVTVLDWQEPEPTATENLRAAVKRKMTNTRANNTNELKAAIESNLGLPPRLSSATG